MVTTDTAQTISGAKKYYLQQFVDNNNCLSSGLEAINKATAEEYMNICKQYIPNTKLRGY